MEIQSYDPRNSHDLTLMIRYQDPPEALSSSHAAICWSTSRVGVVIFAGWFLFDHHKTECHMSRCSIIFPIHTWCKGHFHKTRKCQKAPSFEGYKRKTLSAGQFLALAQLCASLLFIALEVCRACRAPLSQHQDQFLRKYLDKREDGWHDDTNEALPFSFWWWYSFVNLLVLWVCLSILCLSTHQDEINMNAECMSFKEVSRGSLLTALALPPTCIGRAKLHDFLCQPCKGYLQRLGFSAMVGVWLCFHSGFLVASKIKMEICFCGFVRSLCWFWWGAYTSLPPSWLFLTRMAWKFSGTGQVQCTPNGWFVVDRHWRLMCCPCWYLGVMVSDDLQPFRFTKFCKNPVAEFGVKKDIFWKKKVGKCYCVYL